MACHAPCGVLLSAWQAYTLSPTPEQRHWLSAAGKVVGCEQKAAADVLCVCRVGPMTPAQVEIQTEQVQFEEPALSAEQMSANQAGAFYICCCCAACACLAPCCTWRAGTCALACSRGEGGLQGYWGACVSKGCCPDHSSECCKKIGPPSRPAQTGNHALLHASGFQSNSPSRLAGWHSRQCMSCLICPPLAAPLCIKTQPV